MVNRVFLLAWLLACFALAGLAEPASGRQSPGTPQDKRVSIDLNDVEIHAALKRLFAGSGCSYDVVTPDLAGTVMISLKRLPFDMVLGYVLRQVAGEYRRIGTHYEIATKPRPAAAPAVDDSHTEWVPMPQFRPGTFTESYEVRGKACFLTADRTLAGTYDLITQACSRARFGRTYLYQYGEDGFALALPVEELLDNGMPKLDASRFPQGPDLASLDFRQIGEMFRTDDGLTACHYRVLVMLVTTEGIEPAGPSDTERFLRPAGDTGLPEFVGKRTWAKDPKLTVLVYEFWRKTPEHYLLLLPPGRAKIAAKAHVAAAGLWSTAQ